jgi:hypothetical protein
MRELRKRIRIVLSYVLTVLLIGGYPAMTFADTAPVTTTSPADTTVATAPAPAPAPIYTYDPVTAHWNTDKWQYNAGTGQYGPVSTPGPTSPTGPTVTPGPTGTTVPTSGDPTVVETPIGTTPTALGTANTTSPTVTNPTSTITNTGTVNSATNATATNSIGNTVGSTSISGDAGVIANTTAGNATSGGASVAQTVLNTINSSVSGTSGNGIANFVTNITGNVYGDMVISPMILGAMLSNAVLSPVATSTTSAKTALNVATNNQITNNINLNAASGNATVAGNTTAGSATTGSANTVADVVNIINSIIAANKSFVGTINIYGNLNGDILISPDFLPQLLASNAANQAAKTSLNVNVNDTQAIANNVNLAAASGGSTVTGNTSAGNATTGAANTNLTILNLTGHDIVASNSLLVFVNVLGKWVGVIVDAPTGATAAAIGNGVTQNTTTNAASAISSQNNAQITNNINLAAQSGNAAVTNNTNGGNATSGNATSSANILNMSQSSLGLTGWFGILFINVFGSWLGSFGVDTPQGNAPPIAATSDTSGMSVSSLPQAVKFIAKAPGTLSSLPKSRVLAVSNVDPILTQPIESTDSQKQPEILGVSASSSVPPASNTPVSSSGTTTGVAMLGAVLLVGATLRSLWPIIYRRVSRLV